MKKTSKNKSSLYIFFDTIGNLSNFTMQFFKDFLLPPYEIDVIKKHMYDLGVKTFPIVSVTGFIIGFVLALQSEPVLRRFGAEAFLPAMVSISVVRELGPVLTAIIFAGRVSSGIGAEIASMRITEQIDAMELSAIDPYKYLVVTRVIATTLILPLLTMYVIIIALIGCYIAILLSTPTSVVYYITAVQEALTFQDLIPGVAKTFVFGFIVGIVGSFKGYYATKGTEGVGIASTSAVVLSSLLILIFDAILVKITLVVWAM
ncbi:MAG TPA: ABC transporter permease [Ignavibacteriales bacterium]|jgi:phospholipid/cholesterol/gamma-HCH transport system permease protein|nr:ABC transporter permease [Ignavibacteriales bacterium]